MILLFGFGAQCGNWLCALVLFIRLKKFVNLKTRPVGKTFVFNPLSDGGQN